MCPPPSHLRGFCILETSTFLCNSFKIKKIFLNETVTWLEVRFLWMFQTFWIIFFMGPTLCSQTKVRFQCFWKFPSFFKFFFVSVNEIRTVIFDRQVRLKIVFSACAYWCWFLMSMGHLCVHRNNVPCFYLNSNRYSQLYGWLKGIAIGRS